jgi:hypothetical protein
VVVKCKRGLGVHCCMHRASFLLKSLTVLAQQHSLSDTLVRNCSIHFSVALLSGSMWSNNGAYRHGVDPNMACLLDLSELNCLHDLR